MSANKLYNTKKQTKVFLIIRENWNSCSLWCFIFLLISGSVFYTHFSLFYDYDGFDGYDLFLLWEWSKNDVWVFSSRVRSVSDLAGKDCFEFIVYMVSERQKSSEIPQRARRFSLLNRYFSAGTQRYINVHLMSISPI